MKLNLLHRTSTVGPIKTDRPYCMASPNPPLYKQIPTEQHLNPSKSKVNIKQPLAKNHDNFSLSNSHIEPSKNSCIIPNSTTVNHHTKREVCRDDYMFKSNKESADISFDMFSKEYNSRYSQATPNSTFGDESCKKAESVYLQTNSKEGFMFKVPQQYLGSDKDIGDIKVQLLMLSKRIKITQQEITKLKETNTKSHTTQYQLPEFRNQILDYCKKNTEFLGNFEKKLQHNYQLISDIKDKIFFEGEKEQINKRLFIMEGKINDLFQGFKVKEQFSKLQINSQLNTQQSNLKSYINSQITEVKQELEKNITENKRSALKMQQLILQVTEKLKGQEYKISNKKCMNPIIIQNKQTIIIREGEIIRDRTKQYLNHDQNREFQAKQLSIQPKRQLLVKQKIYYLDSQGYLLDQNKYYLLDQKNQQIMVPIHLLACLKENNMLVNSTNLSLRK